jgi:hypothetical protein
MLQLLTSHEDYTYYCVPFCKELIVSGLPYAITNYEGGAATVLFCQSDDPLIQVSFLH